MWRHLMVKSWKWLPRKHECEIPLILWLKYEHLGTQLFFLSINIYFIIMDSKESYGNAMIRGIRKDHENEGLSDEDKKPYSCPFL